MRAEGHERKRLVVAANRGLPLDLALDIRRRRRVVDESVEVFAAALRDNLESG